MFKNLLFLALLLSAFCYGDLTLEEKVGQLLMVQFKGEVANEEALQLIHNAYVGGFIYYNWANSLHDPQQVNELSRSLQEAILTLPHPIPLFIAVDQEGGVVNRLINGFTVFPGNRALAAAKDPQLAEACGLAMGEELSAVGININFAPVVDISKELPDVVLGVRTFGDHPQDVMAFARAMLEGLQKGKVIGVLKHFPGLGSLRIDSHQALPLLDSSLEEMEQLGLMPYQKLCDQADAVMTAHLLIPKIDPNHCVTLSKKSLDYLRKEIGFEGVIFSDSLVMQGVIDNGGTIEETAMKAFQAGCDVLLLGGKQLLGHQNGLELSSSDILKIHRYLVEQVKAGAISEERLNDSVKKIIDLKKKYGLFEFFPKPKNLHFEEHLALAQKIAKKSIQLVSVKHQLPLSFQGKKVMVVASRRFEQYISQTSLSPFERFYFPEKGENQLLLSAAQEADFIICLIYNGQEGLAQREVIRLLENREKPLVGIALGEPDDVNYFSDKWTILKTLSPAPISIETALQLLMD